MGIKMPVSDFEKSMAKAQNAHRRDLKRGKRKMGFGGQVIR